MKKKTIAFTCGDINGIGPEICIKAINQINNSAERKIVLFCPSDIFHQTSFIVNPSFSYKIVKDKQPFADNSDFVTIVDIGEYEQNIGQPTIHSGRAAYKALLAAYDSVANQNVDAIVTAPISKIALRLTGKKFPGQTELLAKLSKSKKYMMVFLSDKFVCGLTTIHEPIKRISKLITKEKIKTSIEILHATLLNDLGIASPSIAVLGLNPHAGENGNIGKEEINAILPAIKSLKKILVNGPYVPDAFFGNQLHLNYSAVLGMYHDQVLIPFKMLNFNTGVNYTAGLPFVRTSPDHGTGYDIAGRGIANPQSIIEAVRWAEKIISNRRNS